MNRNSQIYNTIDFQENTISEINFRKCKFTNCNLTSSLFHDCLLENCSFKSCNLSMLKFQETAFRNVTFEDCKMIGINWSESSTKAKISLNNCTINYSNFFGMNLRGVKITNCIAEEVTFSEANMETAILKNTNFKDSIFHNTNLLRADFTNAKNYNGVNIANPKTTGAKFSLPEATILLYNFKIELV